jgi:hypothetical protein
MPSRSAIAGFYTRGDYIQPEGQFDSRPGAFGGRCSVIALVAVCIVPRRAPAGLPPKHLKDPTFNLRNVMPSLPTLDDRRGGNRLLQLLAPLLALAVSTSLVPAQEWDHIDGRDKVHDPTGAWLVRFKNPDDAILNRNFFLIVFHKSGTLTQNTQGDSGFDPSAVPLPLENKNSENNVISTAMSGVWQKTGWNTFAGTLLDIEYHNIFNPALNIPPDVTLFQFTKEQFTGRLTESGDQMVLSEGAPFLNCTVPLDEPSAVLVGDFRAH